MLKMMRIHVTAIIVLSFIDRSRQICTSKYGGEPCNFLPAPPGHTPPCARPGLTYCEHPEHYPGQLIHYLVKKWRYDHSTLLSDETREEFSTYYFPPDIKYGFNHIETYGPPNSIQHDSYFPEPIQIPKPHHHSLIPSHSDNTYLPPQFFSQQTNFTEGFAGYPERRSFNHFSRQIQTAMSNLMFNYRNPNQFYNNQQPNNNQGQNWKNYVTNNNYQHARNKRSEKVKNLRKKFLQSTLKNETNSEHFRSKRQSPITGQTLCQSTSQYIMPRAALNNKGNWMYVVNMPELDNRFTQLVKSETCASQTCSGLCGLPNGYSSRCEQKYVQKRLVALEGAGNQLYTDVFWFPSCCICTITNN